MSSVPSGCQACCLGKNDEGIQTLFSLSLGSQCLSVPVTYALDRAPRYLISGLLLPPTRV